MSQTNPNPKENATSNWLKKFDKKVWSKLSESSKRKLCQRFELEYQTFMQVNDIVKQIDLPVPPRSFTIAALNETKIKKQKLIRQNPYKDLWMDKISYDIDQWGTIRTNRPYYGLLKNASVSEDQKMLFEKLLVSSSSLNKDEKIKVLTAVPQLSIFQITELIHTFKEESSKFNELFLEHRNDVEQLIKKVEKEWDEIEPNLSYYIGTEENPKVILDKHKHLSPKSIKKAMEESIKGQSLAVQTIATQLYYQHKVKFFYEKEELMPSLEPILVSGTTGSGKSFLLKTGCDIIGLPYLHVDCSSMVSAGIKGYSIGDIIKDLLRKTNYNVKDTETAIIILDEVDKLLAHHDGHSILFQLLHLVEGRDIPIDRSSHSEEKEFAKINSISTDKMLFIFAGSFQTLIDDKNSQSGFIKEDLDNKPISISDIEKTGLPKELLGRISDIVVLNKLQREDYRSILLESKHSPIKKYQKMLAINDDEHYLSEDEIEEIIDHAENSIYGARSLKVVKKYFDEKLFDAPSTM